MPFLILNRNDLNDRKLCLKKRNKKLFYLFVIDEKKRFPLDASSDVLFHIILFHLLSFWIAFGFRLVLHNFWQVIVKKTFQVFLISLWIWKFKKKFIHALGIKSDDYCYCLKLFFIWILKFFHSTLMGFGKALKGTQQRKIFLNAQQIMNFVCCSYF